jgi:FtsP/CotA-like multicopper oxidase with cupredoxin domain
MDSQRTRAQLFDEAGRKIGSHFAGPTWRWSDGSQVTAKPVANATPDPESIPWLLLTATNHTGDGVMKNVSSIQRLQTKGGKAPANGCDESHRGAQARVPFTADYYFYAP